MTSGHHGYSYQGFLRETQRIVFHHVPKTAGTSVHFELVSRFREKDICPERADLLHNYSYAELDNYRLFSGHFDKYNVDLIPSPKILVTFLRDPIERILSLYYYWRTYRWEIINHKNLDGPRFAKSFRLLDFLRCEHPLIRLNIENGLSRSYLSRQCEATWRPIPSWAVEEHAGWALLNLRRYNFVGFAEHFDDDMARLRNLIGLPEQVHSQHLNRFGEISEEEVNVRELIPKQPHTPDIAAALFDLTTVDRPFYAAALAERETLGAHFPN